MKRPVADDVIAVLEEIRHRFERSGSEPDVQDLRKEAIQAIARIEVNARRFANEVSADNSIHDACVRRRGYTQVAEFDAAVDDWLRGRSDALSVAVLAKVTTEGQRQKLAEVLGSSDSQPTTPPMQAVAIDIEEDDLSQGAGAPSAGDSERAGALERVRSQQEEEGAFAPSDLEDARKRILVAIVLRQGQRAFREQLLATYRQSCAVTGCDVVEALEAAHIVAYRGPETNRVTNGLLLRADIHTLFDLRLLAVHPQDYRLIVSRRLRGTAYASLDGQMIRLPINHAEHPSPEALEAHMAAFLSNESGSGQA